MKLPLNWTNIDYKKAIEKISINKKKIKQKEYLKQGNIPVIDQGQEFIGGYTDNKDKIIDCEFPVIVFGDHTKIVKYINFKFAPGADGVKVIRPLEFYYPKLFFYFTKYLAGKLIDKGYSRHFQYLEKDTIPVPPLNEQNRIVEKIEELFSDLDKAVEDLKKTQEQLKIYRQSVLKAAFEGKLINKNSFEYLSFSEICEINPSKKEIADLSDNLDVTFLSMSAVSETGVILKQEIKKLKDVKKGFTYFKNGDILVAKITPCFENGKKAIAKDLKNNIGFGSTEFHVLRPKEKVISEWIYYAISLEDFRNKAKSQMTGTAGQKRVPKRVVESYKIPVPSKPKQKQIVKEIESRLSVCDKLEETIKQSLQKIEFLRQSILKKAFEGELVPQDPNDEPAEKLLERIKREKQKLKSNKKKRSKK